MSTSLLSLPVTSLQTLVSVVLVPELLVSGLEVFEDSCELLSDDVSAVLSVPLVLVLSVLELPEGELGNDTEDSLVVVSDTGCKLTG